MDGEDLFTGHREGLLGQMPYVFFMQADSATNENNNDDTENAEGLLSLNEITKGEYNLVMNSDERAWNRKIIKSFFHRKTRLNAIVLAPNGAVLASLMETVQMKNHRIKGSKILYFIWLITQLLILLVVGLFMYIGLFYWTIINPYGQEFMQFFHTDRLNMTADERITIAMKIRDADLKSGNLILTFSLFQVGWSVLSFKRFDASIASDSQMTRNMHETRNKYSEYKSQIENLELITEALIIDSAFLTSEPRVRGGSGSRSPSYKMKLQKVPQTDASPVPICSQTDSNLRNHWNMLRAVFVIWIFLIFYEMTIFCKVYNKSIFHYENELTVEEMKSRLDVGVAAIAQLQELCFYHKLITVFRGLSIVCFMLFNHWMMLVLLELKNKQRLLADSSFPAHEVNYRPFAVLCLNTLAVLLVIGFFAAYQQTYYFSSVAKTKIPNVNVSYEVGYISSHSTASKTV